MRDDEERFLLIATFVALILLCIVEIRLPLLPILQNSKFGAVLIADATKNIISGLLIGFISAYIFYLFINFLPRKRKEKQTMLVLNSLIASVLDSYNRWRLFGHETALPYVDKSVLHKDWLEEHLVIFKENKSRFLPLIFAMQTSHTRLADFRHVLPLAVSLSPNRALQWLVIIDKIRLLAENYGKQLNDVPREKMHLIDEDTVENPVHMYKRTLNFRMFEIILETITWLYPSINDDLE